VSDYFDDRFFSGFCDKDVVNQYLKLLAASYQALEDKIRRSEVEVKINVDSLLKIKEDLKKERSRISEFCDRIRSQECLIDSLKKEKFGFERELREKRFEASKFRNRIKAQELLIASIMNKM